MTTRDTRQVQGSHLSEQPDRYLNARVNNRGSM